jgi:hypothetical protein
MDGWAFTPVPPHDRLVAGLVGVAATVIGAALLRGVIQRRGAAM